MMRQVLACVLLLSVATLVAGCGGKSELSGVLKAAGTVTHQGKPVEGATVTFSPEGKGRPAAGKTDASGRFQLTTLNSGDGALPGRYQVAVSKIEDLDAASRPSGMDIIKAIEGGKSAPMGPVKGGQKQKGGIKHHLPEKYEKAESSGLTAEVTAGGKNDFTLTLE